MSDPSEAERRRLERVAYGATASAREREEALTLLQRMPVAADGAGQKAVSGAGRTAPEPAEPRRASGPEQPSAAVRRRPRRPPWTTVAGISVIALVAGIAIGWQAAPRGEPPADVVTAAEPDGSPTTPEPILADAPALRVFERAQQLDDIPGVPPAELDPDSFRLLAAFDGANLFAAARGETACLYVSRTDGWDTHVCATGSGFPAEGLSFHSLEAGARYFAIWRADGAVEYSTG